MKRHGGWGKGVIMEPLFRFFVGVDWASQEHTISILDGNRKELENKAYPHTGAGLNQLANRLVELSDDRPAAVAIGIETPHGAVVETMVERGFAVFSLNPKQMDRFRDRHSVSGAKDDRRDAYVIADALATDLHKFHRVKLSEAAIVRLRQLCRNEEDVKQSQVQLGNQLRDLLNRYFPQMLSLCPGVDEPWFWDLVKKAPLPQQAAKLSASKIQRILSAHRIRRIDGIKAREILQAPALRLAPGGAEAASEHVLMLLPQLRLYNDLRKQLTSRIDAVLTEISEDEQIVGHRDVNLLRSLPGVGRCVAATMLAEASQALAERDYHALRSYTGVAPITKSSGKRQSVLMRKSCNERLRNAMYHWARVSTQNDARSKLHYTNLRSKGHSHGRALRGVADRLLAVLFAMLRSGTAYDPARRTPSVVTT
jgi:transposase